MVDSIFFFNWNSVFRLDNDVWIFAAGLHDGRAVLNLSGAELERLTGLSTSDITQLKDAVSEAVLGCQAITCVYVYHFLQQYPFGQWESFLRKLSCIPWKAEEAHLWVLPERGWISTTIVLLQLLYELALLSVICIGIEVYLHNYTRP